MVAVEDLGSSGVCEVRSCVQTSCSILWSGRMLVPLSLPFFSTLACVLGGIRSQASVKGLSRRLLLCFILSFHLSWPFPCQRLSQRRLAVAVCVILFQKDPARVDKCQNEANVSSSAVCMEIYREMRNWVLSSVRVQTFFFCHCDKCIIAPYFTRTKALFVPFEQQFLKLLFSDIV